jgi:tripartite-type tricarboxylate transporter receptor subunit TctC
MQGSLIKTVLLFAALLMATPALATYPEHPINLVVEFAPGGSADIVARLMAQALNSELGQTVIVENKPGAGGNIGGTFVAHAAPDGYTVLLAAAGPIVINPSLYKSMAYSPIKDLAPVTMIEREHNLMVVNNSIPANNLTEFIAYAKAHPGEINFGSPGDGSPAHLAGELLNQKAGLKMQHVPYKGTSPALSDLIGGHITLMIDNMPALLPAVKSGTLRAIAVPSEHRAAAAPDIPTFAEEGMPGFVITAWKGLMVPAGTPQPVIDRLHDAIVKVLARPDVRQKLLDLGAEPVGNTPAQFAVQIKDETEFYSKLVKSTGASID